MARRIGAVEAIEQQLRVNVAKAAAVIFHRDHAVSLQSAQLNGNVTSWLDEAARVFYQVLNNLFHLIGVAQNIGRFSHHGGVRLTFHQNGVQVVHYFFDHSLHIHAAHFRRLRSGAFDFFERNQVFCQVGQAL